VSVDIQQFYGIWPIRGVRFSDQLTEVRDNFNSLAPLVRQAYVDISNNPEDRDLTGLSFGELDMRHRWRWFYDKVNNEFLLQKNTNTEVSPTWENLFSITDNEGTATFSGIGGVRSVGGFYGITRKVSQNFSSSPEWIFNHNLNTSDITWSTRNNNHYSINPSGVFLDQNTTFFYFLTSQSGRATIVG